MLEKIAIIHDGQLPKDFSVVKYNDMGSLECPGTTQIFTDLQAAINYAETWSKESGIELDGTVAYFKNFLAVFGAAAAAVKKQQESNKPLPIAVKELPVVEEKVNTPIKEK